MNDRRHLRGGEDADKEQSAAPRRELRESPGTASIRDLQARAGNRAVAQLLESGKADPTLAPLQRQPSGWRPGSGPGNDGTMSIPDMKLTMPVLSFSHQDRGPHQAKDKSGVVNVTIPLERVDAKLTEASAMGRQFDTITIALGARQTFTLHDVVISSLSLGPQMASLGLSFASMELKLGA